MKPENIVLFKRFLKSEGANSLFAGMYKQYRTKDSPEDVEEFLRQVDAKDAILSAFCFPDKGGQLGFDYWFDKAIKWEKCVTNATASQFYGYCWHNKAKIEKEAIIPLSVFSAYLNPMGKNAPSEIHRALNSSGGSINNPPEKVQKLDAWVGDDFKKQEPKPKENEQSKPVSEEQMQLSGFTMFKVGGRTGSRILDNETISIASKSGHYKICFNRYVSQDIIKAGHPYVHVFSKEQSIYFLFDNSEINGVKWRVSDKNVVFSNKQLIENIRNFFGLKGESYQLTISKNMAKTDRNLFYKVEKK